MPAKYKDYPVYSYDEPATYDDFTGGINTDPSNEHLLDSELRDCVNMTYLSGALVKRKGAKEIARISCEDDLKNIQGIFLFTYKITYIIVAADGKLYQGVFNEDTTIQLTRLYIYKSSESSYKLYDETDAFSGLEEKSDDEIADKFDGYIQTYYKNISTGELVRKNYRGDYASIESGAINKGDVFVVEDSLITKTYLCITTFEKVIHYPTESAYWAKVRTASDSDKATYQEWSKNKNEQWTTQDYVIYGNYLYQCITPHYNRYNSLIDTSLFVLVNDTSTTRYIEVSYLVFQNYRDVEAATFDNKLYIATGTRIIEVSLVSDELTAQPVSPYLCNYTEITKIGYNYMSPYPELAVASQEDTVTTSISGIKVEKTLTGNFILTPVMNIQSGDSADNYYYRWEKYVNGIWYTVITFKSQYQNFLPSSSGTPIEISKSYKTLQVDDADTYQYRCTFAKSFENVTVAVTEWDINSDYSQGDYVSSDGKVYMCRYSHTAAGTDYPTGEFSTTAYLIHIDATTGTSTEDTVATQLWQEVYDTEELPYIYEETSTDSDTGVTSTVTKTAYINDLKVNEVDGEYFGSATSVLFDDNIDINDTFLVIQSCTKILVDGNKMLFYGDNYNSGMWYKTIINNPGYITDRGCLSFKTTKNEELIKIVPFQGNIIAFANSEEVGGSIHLISGNGDDYDSDDGYYSPYKRQTINASVSCDNDKTVQICDNYLVFKYFDRVYYISASDLSNDVVKVTECNGRLKSKSTDVEIPWDDNTCISESTDKYYALIWKEKYELDSTSNELVLKHPGLRVKFYYKMSSQLKDNTYTFPWLRDESSCFNIDHIIYIKGKPIYLYHNLLLSLSEDYYQDIEEDYTCRIHLRGYDLDYPKVYKLIDNVMLYYHRDQYKTLKLNLTVMNEAGHKLISTDSNKKSLQDLKAIREGTSINGEGMRVGSTIQDSRVFNPTHRFLGLLMDTIITADCSGTFSLSSITFNYTTVDVPDVTPYDLYSKIIRPKEVK